MPAESTATTGNYLLLYIAVWAYPRLRVLVSKGSRLLPISKYTPSIGSRYRKVRRITKGVHPVRERGSMKWPQFTWDLGKYVLTGILSFIASLFYTDYRLAPSRNVNLVPLSIKVETSGVACTIDQKNFPV